MTIGTDRLDEMVCTGSDNAPWKLAIISAYEPGYVRCEHEPGATFVNEEGLIFGGYVAALIDDMSGHTALTVIRDDQVFATAELAISYFRPWLARQGRVLLEGFLINQSRRSYHVEVTARGDDEKLLTKGRAVLAISRRSSESL